MYVRISTSQSYVASVRTAQLSPSKSVIIIFELFHFRAVLIEAQSLFFPASPTARKNENDE